MKLLSCLTTARIEGRERKIFLWIFFVTTSAFPEPKHQAAHARSFPFIHGTEALPSLLGKSYLKCSDSAFIHCSYLLHRVPTEAEWSAALTGKGGVPSGTKPWGQKSASRNVETVVFDEWARYVENAATTSHSFLSGVLCSRWQGRYQLPPD